MTYNLSKPFADDTPCKQHGLLPPLEPELMSVHDQLEGTSCRGACWDMRVTAQCTAVILHAAGNSKHQKPQIQVLGPVNCSEKSQRYG